MTSMKWKSAKAKKLSAADASTSEWSNSAPIIRDQPVVAKYEGRCKGCGHLILVGDILTKRHSTWVCRKCDVLEEDELTASMALVAADAAKPELVLSNSVKDRLREKMLRRLDAAGKRS